MMSSGEVHTIQNGSDQGGESVRGQPVPGRLILQLQGAVKAHRCMRLHSSFSRCVSKLRPAPAAAAGPLLYFAAPHTLLPGVEIVAASSNLQDSVEGCAASCVATPRCRVFNYCPPGAQDTRLGGSGCQSDPTGSSALPPSGCQLVWQVAAETAASVIVFGQGPACLRWAAC